MKIPHAVVWLDHHEARVLFLHEDDSRFEEQHLKAHSHHGHNHHHEHHGVDKAFFESIVKVLEPVREVLLAGPGAAKNEFNRYTEDHARPLHGRILGVESLDHPTEGQLAALARRFFKKADAMLGDPTRR